MIPFGKTFRDHSQDKKEEDFIPYGDYLGLTKEEYEARINLLHEQARSLKQNDAA